MTALNEVDPWMGCYGDEPVVETNYPDEPESDKPKPGTLTLEYIQYIQGMMFDRISEDWDEPRERTSVDDDVAAEIFNACNKARSGSSNQLIGLPTGCGKTTTLLAYIEAEMFRDPNFSVAFVTDAIDGCVSSYNTFSDFADSMRPYDFYQPGDVGLWTSNKGANGDMFSFEPITESNAGNCRFLITTNAKRNILTEKSGTDGPVFRWKGRKRSLVIVDEMPDMVSVGTMTADIIAKLKTAADVVGYHDYSKFLADVYASMDTIQSRSIPLKGEGPRLIECDLINQNYSWQIMVTQFTEFLDKYSKVDKSKLLENAITMNQIQAIKEFLECACEKQVIYDKRSPRRFWYYRTKFKSDVPTVIADATAGISNVDKHIPGFDLSGTLRVSYQNVNIHHFHLPDKFQNAKSCNVNELNQYKSYIDGTIERIVKPGDKVLAVVPKILMPKPGQEQDDDTLRLTTADSTYSYEDGGPRPYLGGHVSILNHGRGIGTNRFADCNKVVIFARYIRPTPFFICLFGGLHDLIYSNEDLSGINGSNTIQGSKSLQSGDWVKWLVQIAARGCMRVIRADGTTKPMELYLSLPEAILAEYQQGMFPGSKPFDYFDMVIPGFESSSRKKYVGQGGVIKAIHDAGDEPISIKQICEVTGDSQTHVSRSLKSDRVTDFLARSGLVTCTGKQLGIPGKAIYVVRNSMIANE